MRRATVVGAGGFIGGRLVAHLRGLGWDCAAPARDDTAFLRQPLGTVFYCAGLTADFASRPHDTVRAHVGLLNELLDGGRFDALVYLSSTRLYDGLAALDGGALDETTPLSLDPAAPRHLYDLSKALGESLCRHAGGGRARVARLSCVYGGVGDPDGFLGGLLRTVRDGRGEPVLRIDAAADAARDYVHVDDVVAALTLIATAGSRPVYNVAGGVNVLNAQLFARLGKLAGSALHAARTLALPVAAPVSIARMAHEFGWRPTALLDRLPALVREALAP